jgi:hypothetical protein
MIKIIAHQTSSPWRRVLLEKLIAAQLVEIPAFYETHSLSQVQKSLSPDNILRQINSVHILT